MNVAFFINSFPVLSQTFILNQITGLLDKGHCIDIYAHRINEFDVVHHDVEKYNLRNRVFLHGANEQFMPNGKIDRLAKAVNLLIEKWHDHPQPLLRSLNFLRFGTEALSLRLFYKVYALLDKRDKYDVLHCHFGPNGLLAAKLKRIGAIEGRIITTFHGFDMSKYIEEQDRDVYRELFEVGDLFLPVTEVMKQDLIKFGCPPGKIIVHRMGVDVGKFAPRPPEQGREVHLLSVGRLVEKKGLSYGIRAVGDVLRKHPGVSYRIVGDGPLRESLEGLINGLGLGERVQILGWKSQEEIKLLMRDSDIFLAPSVTDRNGDKEGLPVVLMEALATGLPVLSTVHSGIPELVEDGVSGFLSRERDAAALARHLSFLIAHPDKCDEMGRAGREKVEREFDITKLNDRLTELYAMVCPAAHSMAACPER